MYLWKHSAGRAARTQLVGFLVAATDSGIRSPALLNVRNRIGKTSIRCRLGPFSALRPRTPAPCEVASAGSPHVAISRHVSPGAWRVGPAPSHSDVDTTFWQVVSFGCVLQGQLVDDPGGELVGSRHFGQLGELPAIGFHAQHDGPDPGAGVNWPPGTQNSGTTVTVPLVPPGPERTPTAPV